MNTHELAISYLVAAHNEQAILKSAMERLAVYLAPFRHKNIYIVENGSRDNTFEIAKALEKKTPFVTALREPRAGMGHAHHRAILEALARKEFADTSHWLVLNGADIPFDDSDLNSFIDAWKRNPEIAFVIGSKSHPESNIQIQWTRKWMSHIFRIFRRAILGMKTQDSQGSLFIRADLLRQIYGKVHARDFFHMTELVYQSEKMGVLPLEIPVVYRGDSRPSKVHPLCDGARMLASLFRVRLSRS